MALVTGTQYASTADLANLGLVSAALANVQPGMQDAALVASSAVIDSYLESRYALPLVSWGSDLVRVASVIAAYDIMTARGYNPAAGTDTNIRQRYLDALAVKEGDQTPAYILDADGSDGTSTPGGDGSVSTSAGGFGFTTSAVRGFTERGVPLTRIDGFNPWDI